LALHMLARTAHSIGGKQTAKAQDASAIELVKLLWGENQCAGHQRLLDEDAPRQIARPDHSGRSIYRGGTAATARRGELSV
jgi:hypothetical protein